MLSFFQEHIHIWKVHLTKNTLKRLIMSDLGIFHTFLNTKKAGENIHVCIHEVQFVLTTWEVTVSDTQVHYCKQSTQIYKIWKEKYMMRKINIESRPSQTKLHSRNTRNSQVILQSWRMRKVLSREDKHLLRKSRRPSASNRTRALP